MTGTNAVSIGNTLLALNHSPGTSADISGSVTSLGYNLVGMVDGSSGLGATGDLTGTAASPLAPGTGPLAENGGPTLTHALLPESPAINAGSSELAADLLEDQRGVGFPRLVDGAVDIGAYEFQLGFVGFVRFQITPSGNRLKLQGLPNKPLQIEWNAEARPAGWQPLHSSATDALGVLEYTDTGALTSASRFYRAVIPQP